MHSFIEFFAGGGMARAGLGETDWQCQFANDFDHKKSDVYRRNWGGGSLRTADIRTIASNDVTSDADLAWASFPCQDLSLAGAGAGLKGGRSGTFWPFWSLMTSLAQEGRAPKIIALENVCGTLTSHGGADFAAICSTFGDAGYSYGAVVIDAALFVPQSRPRLFIIGVRGDVEIPGELIEAQPSLLWHSQGLRRAFKSMPAHARKNWLWWTLPTPLARGTIFADLIEENPIDVAWHTPSQTRLLLAMMSDVNREKVESAKRMKKRMVGAIINGQGWMTRD